MLFDTSLLQTTDLKAIPEDYRSSREINSFIEPFRIYDHFVTNNVEIIILSHFVYNNEHSREILAQHNFKIKHGSFVREHNFIAYRSTTEPSTYNTRHGAVMCVMACDLNSATQIKSFCEYYFSEGIEKIFIFYTQPGNLVSRNDLPKNENIIYNEWDYSFYQRYNNKNYHNCQTHLYAMFLNKISPFCEWTFFCDLDERIIVKNSSLKDYLNTQNKHLFTTHARIPSVRVPLTRNEMLMIDYDINTPRRGKSVVKGDLLKELPQNAGVHYVVKDMEIPYSMEPDENLIMLHGFVEI